MEEPARETAALTLAEQARCGMTRWEATRQAVEIVDLAVIGVLAIQLCLFLLIFVAAGVALVQRPPFASPALLWRRYADVAPAITIISPGLQ
jgi:hypothetical protein